MPASADGRCRVSEATVTLRIEVSFRWSTPRGAWAAVAAAAYWWRYARALARHEQGHVDYARARYAAVVRAIRGATCRTANAAAEQQLELIRRHDVAYDAATRHGATRARASRSAARVLTILFGLASAVGWGAPDAVLAQAVRRIGAFPVVFGSIAIGTVLASPLALVLDLPDWTERSLVLAPLVGVLTVVGFQAGFMSFKDGAVSVVAPIIACEGGVAALFSIAGGERVNGLVLVGLPFAVAGVVLVSRGEAKSNAGVVPAVAAALIWAVCSRCRRRSPTTSVPAGRSCSSAAARSSPCSRSRSPVGAPRAARVEWWRVAIWGVCDALALLRVRAGGRPRAGRGRRRLAGPVRHGAGRSWRSIFFGERLRTTAGRGDRDRGARRRGHGGGRRVTQSRP